MLRVRVGAWLAVMPVVLLLGCARQRTVTAPEPASVSARCAPAPGTGDAAAHAAELSRALLARWPPHRVSELHRRSLTHRRLWAVLTPTVDSSAGVAREEIGRSVEGRPLYALVVGRGPVRVLLWSQMHGNEPTATLALADLVHFIRHNPHDALVGRIVERLTVVAIPMLNPDGAERSRRENASGIDINRDARLQRSPEARALAAAHARWSPRFAFNLHDQGRRLDHSGRVVAVSLLAPHLDRQRSDGATRTRAMQLAALLRVAAEGLIDGRITRYDDAFNPHAFGDAMQSWGSGTVLIETGDWDGDNEKEYLRQVNFALLLTALDAIATDSYSRIGLDGYQSLPESRSPPHRR